MGDDETVGTNALVAMFQDSFAVVHAMFDKANPNPQYEEWKNVLHDDLDKITNTIKPILREARPKPLPKECWVAIAPPDNGPHDTIIRYARRKELRDGTTYELAWLNQHGRPHL